MSEPDRNEASGKRRHQLGELQLAIMRVLWDADEATVHDVRAALAPQRDLAMTTVATMLRKMTDKGVVTYRAEGRQFVYRPTIEESDVHRTMVGELVDRLFDGSSAKLVTHLIDESDIDPDELETLFERIRARKSETEADRAN